MRQHWTQRLAYPKRIDRFDGCHNRRWVQQEYKEIGRKVAVAVALARKEGPNSNLWMDPILLTSRQALLKAHFELYARLDQLACPNWKVWRGSVVVGSRRPRGITSTKASWTPPWSRTTPP